MIAVIDYGMGNLRSVEKAFVKLGADVRIVNKPKDLARADKAILPGVGSYRDTMEGLQKTGLDSALKEYIASGKPYLGICLGLQILFDESEEGGKVKGLGIIKGRVKRFQSNKGLKVPHMGWNQLDIKEEGRNSVLLKGIEQGSYFYYVHSYYAEPADEDIIVAKTSYGLDFVSIINRDNIFAMQFHPEKSQSNGMTMLRNFIEI